MKDFMLDYHSVISVLHAIKSFKNPKTLIKRSYLEVKNVMDSINQNTCN